MRVICLALLLTLLFPRLLLAAERTPMGSLVAGNQDGSIPPWIGGYTRLDQETPPSGYPAAPYAEEEPIRVVTHSNQDGLPVELTPGQKALLEAYPDSFRMRVFPSHRSYAAPSWVYEGMKLNARHARLSDDGRRVLDLSPGMPFPQPANGLEAVWNHLLRFRGTFVRRVETEVVVYPSGSRKVYRSRQEIAFPTYKRDGQRRDEDVLLYYSSFLSAPAQLAGGGFLLVDFLNHQQQEERLAWSYDQSQRRVRRLPYTSFDSPALLSDNLRTVDDTDMFNGYPGLYEWELVGLEERWIPYNNFALPQAPLEALLTPHHLNPELVRWERHRVWKVIGRLKPGHRHLYPKRVFYIDEDSWSIAISENYDRQGNLWRVGLSHPMSLYTVPVPVPTADVFHDLRSGYYNAKGLLNGHGVGSYMGDIPDDSYFQPSRLRQRAAR